jgi:hypothetical protein
MKVLPFRAIVPDDGKTSQKQLFDGFISLVEMTTNSGSVPAVPIAGDLVPRLVNPKQFDVIQFRRQVQFCMEERRVSCGMRPDGVRIGEYKCVQRHIIAKRRPRNPSGTFQTGAAESKNELASICNS